MKVLSSSIKQAFTIKKSKFLCFGFFVQHKDEVKKIVDEFKKTYPDASHICFAYILDDKTFYYTDGGEPSGSAGKPIYGALLSQKLNYTLFIVVRYFGGIKFGPGPLRSTFKDVTNKTLQTASFKTRVLTDVIEIQISYSSLKQISIALKPWIHDKQFTKEWVNLTLVGNKIEILKKLSLLKIKPTSVKENQVV